MRVILLVSITRFQLLDGFHSLDIGIQAFALSPSILLSGAAASINCCSIPSYLDRCVVSLYGDSKLVFFVSLLYG
jgi:hypothetical protein